MQEFAPPSKSDRLDGLPGISFFGLKLKLSVQEFLLTHGHSDVFDLAAESLALASWLAGS